MRTKIVVVDDCSKDKRKCVDICSGFKELEISVFRVHNDLPWNHRAARNIGFFESDSGWILAVDIDTIPDLGSFSRALPKLNITEKAFFLVNRIELGTKKPLGIHHDTYLISKENYWLTGGFDENFCGRWGFGKIWFRDAKRLLSQRILLSCYVMHSQKSDPLDSQTNLLRKRTILQMLAVEFTRFSQRLVGVPRRKTLTHPYSRVF